MRKYSCLDCKNYCPKQEVVDGYEEVCGGIMLIPKTKVIKPHCNKHPWIFKRWWKENGNKKADDIETPKCIEIHDHLKTLGEMIDLAKEILERNNETNNN